MFTDISQVAITLDYRHHPISDKARYVAHDAVAQFTILCRASNLAETPLASRAHRHLLRPSTNCYTLSDRNKPKSTPVRHLPLTIPRVRLRSRQWSVVSLGQNSDCQMTGHPRHGGETPPRRSASSSPATGGAAAPRYRHRRRWWPAPCHSHGPPPR